MGGYLVDYRDLGDRLIAWCQQGKELRAELEAAGLSLVKDSSLESSIEAIIGFMSAGQDAGFKQQAAEEVAAEAKVSPRRSAKPRYQTTKLGLPPLPGGPLKNAIAFVMGDKVMQGKQVLRALRKHGWVSKAVHPLAAIQRILSQNPSIFKHVGKSRGKYKVRFQEPAKQPMVVRAAVVAPVPPNLPMMSESRKRDGTGRFVQKGATVH